MFTVEFKINGALIIHIYGHNEGAVSGRGKHYNYTCEVYELGKAGTLKTFEVRHRRDQGLFKLTELIIKKARKEGLNA